MCAADSGDGQDRGGDPGVAQKIEVEVLNVSPLHQGRPQRLGQQQFGQTLTDGRGTDTWSVQF